jgi:hypothetical protein
MLPGDFLDTFEQAEISTFVHFVSNRNQKALTQQALTV